VWNTHWSDQVAKLAVWLGGLTPFEQAAAILEKVGRIDISASSVWQLSQGWGERIKAVEEVERVVVTALPSRGEVVKGQPGIPAKRMGLAMDGAMVPLREEGWKELKVGCVFDLEVRPTWESHSQEVQEIAHAVHNSYVSHLGGPEVFGQLLWAEAQRRGWGEAWDTQVLGDAAPWIWNVAAQHFYESRQAIDWYHAAEHLAHAANGLEGEGTAAAQRWFKSRETPLYQGHAQRIGRELSQAALSHPAVAHELRREAGYFLSNHRRMQYLELREDGFAIGSGMVESGCKQFRARFCGPGMRWSRTGIEHLLPVRAAVMGGSFDLAWQAAHNLPQN
jgi:hypothetical protein